MNNRATRVWVDIDEDTKELHHYKKGEYYRYHRLTSSNLMIFGANGRVKPTAESAEELGKLLVALEQLNLHELWVRVPIERGNHANTKR